MNIIRSKATCGALVAVLSAAVLTGGCSTAQTPAPPQGTAPSATGTATRTTANPDDSAAAAALDKLVYQGLTTAKDKGACFLTAARTAGLNDATLSRIVELDSADWGAAVAVVRSADAQQGELMAGSELGVALDRCVNADMGVGPDAPELAAPSASATAAAQAQAEPDLKPAYEVKADEDILNATQLSPGLVSMFASFDDGSGKLREGVKAGADCLTSAVLSAGLSQKTLHFIAGGAPLGTGSITEHLDEADQAIWNSSTLTAELSACVKA